MQEFLAQHGIETTQTVDAKKKTFKGKAALSVLENIDTVIAAKGKKVVRYDLKKDRPLESALLAVLLGPTGNLRAPALRTGTTLMIGFDETVYKNLFQ